MSRIDFAFGVEHRLRTACDVVRKHYLAGRKVIVYTQDLPRLAYFDQLLWGFDNIAFVPHVSSDDPLAPDTAVILADTDPVQARERAAAPDAWLLNLDLECPPGADAFSRILEIVSNHDQDKAAARLRWRRYLDAGHDLHAHNVASAS